MTTKLAISITTTTAILMSLALPAAAAERTFYYKGFEPAKDAVQHWVSPDGDDANAGTKDKPWKTLAQARKATKGGEVLNILPGLYIFSGDFGPAGTETAKTVWRAADPTYKTGRVVLTGGESFQAPRWHHANYVSIQGLWIGGNYASANRFGEGSMLGTGDEIVNCTFFNNAGIAGGPTVDWLFQNNRIVHSGRGHLGHSIYMSGHGSDDNTPDRGRNFHILGNIVLCGEGYAYHCWHSPASATIAGNFSCGSYMSLVLQGPNHACYYNVLWRENGDADRGEVGQIGFNAWLPAKLRRFDHMVLASPWPIWQQEMPPIRSEQKIEEIYLLYDAPIAGVPKDAIKLLTGKPYTGTLHAPEQRYAAEWLPYPGPTTVKPAFFPRGDQEVGAAVLAIDNYFKEHDPRQVAEDKSDDLEKLFGVLEVQYSTVKEDYQNFPPVGPSKENDATWGTH